MGEEAREQISVASFLSHLTRQWKWFWGTVVLVLIGAILLALFTPPLYEAKARLLIESPTPTAVPGNLALLLGSSNPDVETQVEILKTRPLIEAIRQQLGYSEPYREFKERFRISPVRGTNLIEVRALEGDPNRAAELANLLTQKYLDFVKQIYRQNPGSISKQLEKGIEAKEKELAQIENQLTRFLQEHSLVIPDEQFKTFLSRYSDLMKQYVELRSSERGSLKRIETLRAQIAAQHPSRALSLSFAIPTTVQEYSRQLADLEIEKFRLLEEYQPSALEVQQKEQAIKQVKRSLEQALKEAVGAGLEAKGQSVLSPLGQEGFQQLLLSLLGAQVELDTTRAVLRQVEGQLRQMEGELSKAPQLLNRYQSLMRQQVAAQTVWSQRIQAYEQMRAQELVGQVNPLLLEPAVAPDKPVAPRPILLSVIGLLFGLLLGSLVAFWRDSVDRRLVDRWSVEKWLGVPVLLELPATVPTSEAIQPLFYALLALGGGQAWHHALLVPLQPTEQVNEWCQLIQDHLEWLNEHLRQQAALPPPSEPTTPANALMIHSSHALTEREAIPSFLHADRLILIVPSGLRLTPHLQEVVHWLQPRLLGVVLLQPASASRRSKA